MYLMQKIGVLVMGLVSSLGCLNFFWLVYMYLVGEENFGSFEVGNVFSDVFIQQFEIYFWF